MPKMQKKSKKKFWNFKALNEGTGELLLYGEISDATWWGDEVTPKQFKEDLDALGDITALNVYINSPGGDVFAGQAIHSMLKRHSATITVYVDGLAASIASVIAEAGDKVIMPSNAMFMVHNPWTYGMGNADDFRKLADDLDKIAESMIAAYLSKAKDLDRDKLVEIMNAETWLTAQEAIEYGFADELEDAKDYAASLTGRFLNLYDNTPEDLPLIAKGKPKGEPPDSGNDENQIAKAKLALEKELAASFFNLNESEEL